ncbi:uncharacterized protein LOC110181148 isoform X2 [Drosophila serrata]|uniref:uncharacterized protein LOC110181148 isoform X2 n=1 Tax=Drosophila serrata TaxID=7274 RepID=UPI000A1D1374|nr:uncharacterized protein LOC110181148 isoform X2 [Drosophila serrata]
MEYYVDMSFTENYLLSKEEFHLEGNISLDFNGIQTPKIKVRELDLKDFPDLSQPLPEVSIREQLRLTSLNRVKVLSWQRGQQKHFLDMWQSHLPGNQVKELNHGETSVD